MSGLTQEATLSSTDASRHRLVRDLRRAQDNARSGPLADTVKANIEQLWKHGAERMT